MNSITAVPGRLAAFSLRLARISRTGARRCPEPQASAEKCGLLLVLLMSISTFSKAEDLLIDDFSSADGRSALGTSWQGFTDRVMGGRSDMQAGYQRDADQTYLKLQGQVRLENNGGFIQVRLPLSKDGSGMDARPWAGITVRVRGQPGPYYVHLRSADTRRPWQYYSARIDVTPEWQAQFIAFSSFEPQDLSRPLDLAELRSLGIVAYGEDFAAEIDVARIELRSADTPTR